MMRAAISRALSDHRADPVFIDGQALPRSEAISLLAVLERADSRGHRPSGRFEGSAPAVFTSFHSTAYTPEAR